MKRFRYLFVVCAVAVLMIAGVTLQAEGQHRNEKQVRDLVRSLASKVDDFQYSLSYQLRSNSADSQDIAYVTTGLKNLQDKLSAFESNLDQKRENRDDVQEVITAAKNVDAFLSQNQQSRRFQQDWQGVRDLVTRLSAQYGVIPDWSRGVSNNPVRRPGNAPQMSTPVTYDAGLTGTYKLDPARSENIADVIASSGISDAQRKDLESKLEAPQEIAIDVRGNQVTFATSESAPMTLTADGRETTDPSGGEAARLKATMSGQQLSVSSLGKDIDYTITLVSTDNGRTLKVTRRFTTDYLPETVFVDSVYTKTDQTAGLGIDRGGRTVPNKVAAPAQPDDSTYSTNDPNDRPNANPPSPGVANPQSPNASPGRTGDFVVPNGTSVTGILESTIDTKVSVNGDRFKLTVQTPNEFRGAVIEGYISGVGRSGRVSGNSNVTFNFESITLRSGERYDFAGTLIGVRDQYGKPVKVDTEGAARGDSQTRETAKRGGLGAGLGALIGVIAGGGRGAAIGAIIGGGAGAGSVIAQGRDDIQLMKGSTITIQASSPIRPDQPVSEN